MEIPSRENPSPPPTPTPTPITRSDPNSPYPTTFITADTTSFKQVVQMLTGSSETNPKPPTPSSSRTFVIPPIKPVSNKKQHQNHQQGFKLYERRMKNNLLKISPLNRGPAPEILSPSVLDFPSLRLSPVTPLTSAGEDDQFEEERAIAEKGFYLHRSPLSTPRDVEPQLLPLFPVTSPRVSDPSSSTSGN